MWQPTIVSGSWNVGKFTRHNQFQTLLVHGFPWCFDLDTENWLKTTVITIKPFSWRKLLFRELTYPPKNAIFEDDFPNFPRWDMLIPWRVVFMESESTFELMIRFQHRVPPQRPRSCRRCILGRRFAFPWRFHRVEALSVLLRLELVNMFLSRIQTPCRPLVSSVYYFWCTKMPMIWCLVIGWVLFWKVRFFLCSLLSWFQVRLEHPIAIGVGTNHFLGWIATPCRYQISDTSPQKTS